MHSNDTDNIKTLRNRDLPWLLEKAWTLRTAEFPNELLISSPGAKTYITDHHRNEKNTFVNVSVTGTDCALSCEHCNKTLLETMESVRSPDELIALGDDLASKGCEGLLLSGGADIHGEVPILQYGDAIKYLKNLGLKILVHSGLATKETARMLKESGVDQVLLDVIGSESTLREVYHLDKTPDDVYNSLKALVDEGLNVVPHILVGLHYGRIDGEFNALEMIMRAGVKHIVIIVLMPKRGTPMENSPTPTPLEVGKIIAVGRILNPKAKITLGCARPAGDDKLMMEKYAIQGGVNGIAYATDEAMDIAEELNLTLKFSDTCCSLL